ncbi:MAG: hypothetical protein CVV27_00500 [Candidatus Melainabacteria bacterium HGW-Melainabacteria-1]|nr:MAG: hypothetical protein CVV27_00500 [Candidatus Melainabacteria bacterium HGW-Melainabacteria-1]
MKPALTVFTQLASTALILGLAAPAQADGMLMPHLPRQPIAPIREVPNFAIKHHKVKVTIKDQVAETSVDQVFHNPINRELEGTYLFPVPEGAVMSRFMMDVDGKMTSPELLTAGEARRIYEEIVRRRVDPGLLEYAGQNLYRARVFPIPARGDKAMKLGYEQVIERKDTLHHYRYGLSTEKFSSQPLQNASISITIETRQPLKNIYSPSHEISVHRIDDTHATVSWEASQVKPDQDFDLYWSTSTEAIGATLLSFKDGNDDGYFMLLAAPKVEWPAAQAQSRQMTFVVDTSGSMSGEKIKQAREALAFNLNQLTPRDQFHVLSFSDIVNPFTPGLVQAQGQPLSDALRFARGLEANGGTNINEALLTALKTPAGQGVPMLLFLTDGDPTVGVTDFGEILKNVKAANQRDVRLFVFGVGYDVNIPFLDKLAKENHGTSEFVRPNESIETKVSRLFAQISHPVLTSPKLSWGTSSTRDVLPTQLPDVFKGSQMVVVGRYRSPGSQTVTLSGQVNGKPASYSFPNQSFAAGRTPHSFLPRLWASRRIGQLLDQIRLSGQNKELVEEVIRLSKQYGIITEYTSFLVRDEVDVRARADAAPMMQQAEEQFTRSLSEADKGGSAVSQSQNAANLQKQAAPAPAGGGSYLDAEGQTTQVHQVKYVAQRAFYLKNGLWQDSLPAEKLPQLNVERFSPLYFALAQQPGVKDILALGEQVEFVYSGHLLRIADKGQSQLSPEIKNKLKL